MGSSESFETFPLRFERKGVAKLALHDIESHRPDIEATTIRLLCLLSIYAPSNVFSPHRSYDVLIDTGAPFSVFPYQFWKNWEAGTIEKLEPSNLNAEEMLQFGGTDGDSIMTFIGRIEVSLLNKHEKRDYKTPKFAILGKFLKSKSPKLNRVLLGMQGMEPFESLLVNNHRDRACLGYRGCIENIVYDDP